MRGAWGLEEVVMLGEPRLFALAERWIIWRSEDPDVRRRAVVFAVILMVCQVAVALCLIAVFVLLELVRPWVTLAAGLGFLGVNAFCLAIVRRGRVALAGVIGALGSSLTGVLVSFIYGQFNPSIILSIVGVVMAGFALSYRQLIPIVLVVVGGVVGVVAALSDEPTWTHYQSVWAVFLGFTLLGVSMFSLIHSYVTSAFVSREWELRREAEQARERAELASAAKANFMANMSHELRTPLNAIIGYSELVKEEIEDIDGEVVEILGGDIDKIHTAGHHLLHLVGNILDLSKIESGAADLLIEEVDVEATISDVVSMVASLSRARGNVIEVNVSPDARVFEADGLRVRQILTNLLSNAVKFTSEGNIRVEALSREGALVLRVEDDGIGMAPEQCERVFDPFYQVDSSSTKEFGGAGVGLSLVARLVELLGGEIGVESELGVGSTFEVVLPERRVC